MGIRGEEVKTGEGGYTGQSGGISVGRNRGYEGDVPFFSVDFSEDTVSLDALFMG